MLKFEVGKTYSHKWIGDSDLISEYEIIKRTAKTITIDVNGTVKNLRCKEFEGAEAVKPFGSYSMAPTLRAAKEVK